MSTTAVTTLTLDSAKYLLTHAKMASDVFGVFTYKELAKVTHTDANPTRREEATDVFQKLAEWYDILLNPKTIKGTEKSAPEYTLGRKIAQGDVCDVYYVATPDGITSVAKIARTASINPLVAREREIVTQLAEKADGSHYKNFFPRITDAFITADNLRVNIFQDEDGYFTANEIKEQYPKGFGPADDLRHLIWSLKRTLTAIGYAHSKGWVHCAVLPMHTMYHAENHGLHLVDWTMATKIGERVQFVPSTYKDWYPPEIKTKKLAHPGMDIYMTISVACWLVNGTIPTPKTKGMFPATIPPVFRTFLQSCWLESPAMRPNDAWDVLEKMESLARDLLGPPTYCKLAMK